MLLEERSAREIQTSWLNYKARYLGLLLLLLLSTAAATTTTTTSTAIPINISYYSVFFLGGMRAGN